MPPINLSPAGASNAIAQLSATAIQGLPTGQEMGAGFDAALQMKSNDEAMFAKYGVFSPIGVIKRLMGNVPEEEIEKWKTYSIDNIDKIPVATGYTLFGGEMYGKLLDYKDRMNAYEAQVEQTKIAAGAQVKVSQGKDKETNMREFYARLDKAAEAQRKDTLQYVEKNDTRKINSSDKEKFFKSMSGNFEKLGININEKSNKELQELSRMHAVLNHKIAMETDRNKKAELNNAAQAIEGHMLTLAQGLYTEGAMTQSDDMFEYLVKLRTQREALNDPEIAKQYVEATGAKGLKQATAENLAKYNPNAAPFYSSAQGGYEKMVQDISKMITANPDADVEDIIKDGLATIDQAILGGLGTEFGGRLKPVIGGAAEMYGSIIMADPRIKTAYLRAKELRDEKQRKENMLQKELPTLTNPLPLTTTQTTNKVFY